MERHFRVGHLIRNYSNWMKRVKIHNQRYFFKLLSEPTITQRHDLFEANNKVEGNAYRQVQWWLDVVVTRDGNGDGDGPHKFSATVESPV